MLFIAARSRSISFSIRDAESRIGYGPDQLVFSLSRPEIVRWAARESDLNALLTKSASGMNGYIIAERQFEFSEAEHFTDESRPTVHSQPPGRYLDYREENSYVYVPH